MRIVHLFATLIAVLAAVPPSRCGAPDNTSSSLLLQAGSAPHRAIRSLPSKDNFNYLSDRERRAHGRLTSREMMQAVRREEAEGLTVECCPSLKEMVQPEGGRNIDGLYVELFSNGENKQRFYELSCHPDFINKPCRFVDRRLYNESRCVQKFSYTYALVRDNGENSPHHQNRHRHFPLPPGSGQWMMDYISVRSGCACEFHARKKQKPPVEKRHHAGSSHRHAGRGGHGGRLQDPT